MGVPLPSYGEAAATVYEYASRLFVGAKRTESIALGDALGRVLARPVRADRDMPAFPRSTRDGYALRASEASDWLSIAGSIRAGDPPAAPLASGSAWEIMTGAAVPEDADAVAMLEHVETAQTGQDGTRVRLAAGRKLEVGENVVPAAAEARAGDELIPAGTRIGAAQIAAAATCGYAAVEVFVRPRVAIFTTGDELVPVDVKPGPGQIRNSNGPMLAALVARAGGESWLLPAVRDERASMELALRTALDADLLLISGGVSAGKFDLVEPALAELGAAFHFTGVRMQPGKPLVFGELPIAGGRLPFFGHPGNPISTAATFLLFAAPVLRALAGQQTMALQFSVARLARDVHGKPNLTRFIPARETCEALPGEMPSVSPVPWQGSGDLAAFARANCFLVVPEGVDRIAAGETATILPI
jgi:molybdopterin molybdotransferase